MSVEFRDHDELIRAWGITKTMNSDGMPQYSFNLNVSVNIPETEWKKPFPRLVKWINPILKKTIRAFYDKTNIKVVYDDGD